MESCSRPSWLVPAVTGLVLVLGAACSDDGSGGPGGPGDDEPLFPVFMRADSSVVVFGSSALTYVWCGSWEDGVDTPALRVFHGSLDAEHPGWFLQAAYGDFSEGDTLRFPNSFIWDHPDSAFCFLLDPPNELSTNDEESGGYIVFHRMPCPDAGSVEFDIDAVLGSEFAEMPTVGVKGTFRHEYTTPPPWVLTKLRRASVRHGDDSPEP